jgi:colanic acid/amylovoran biosynthesis glycosyltransferase
VLAIASNSFHQPSETFIRAHVATIMPGRTVLICNDGREAETLGCPVLSNIDSNPAPRHPGERLLNRLRSRWRRYVDPALSGQHEKRVHSFLQTHSPQALLAEFGPVGCTLYRACARANVPLFVHFHGYDATMLARISAWRRHYRRLFESAAGIIAPSQFLADCLARLGCPESKLHISSYGINEKLMRESSREPGRFLAVGRLVEKKAPHLSIRAFAQVASMDSSAHLDMVGKGPLRDTCESEIKQHNLDGRVTLHGALPHDVVQDMFARCSVFVQHSIEAQSGDCEGLPVAILEAMASAVPVVTTRHSGIPESVTDGKTGFLVSEHDVTGMAEMMLVLLRDPKRAAQMGRAGRADVESRFTHAHAAKRLRNIMGLTC